MKHAHFCTCTTGIVLYPFAPRQWFCCSLPNCDVHKWTSIMCIRTNRDSRIGQRISAAIDAAAAAGSAASTIERATMTKSAPASMAVRALPP